MLRFLICSRPRPAGPSPATACGAHHVASGPQRDERRAGDDPVGDAPEVLDFVDDLVADRQPRVSCGVARPLLGDRGVAAGDRSLQLARAYLILSKRTGTST